MSRLATTADLHFALGKITGAMEAKVGAALANVGAATAATRAEPLTYVGGVGLAKFSASEATAYADPEIMQMVGAYAKDAALFANAGLSLEDFVRSEFVDKYGIGMGGSLNGYEGRVSGDALSAITKQSEMFATRFPVRGAGPHPLSDVVIVEDVA